MVVKYIFISNYIVLVFKIVFPWAELDIPTGDSETPFKAKAGEIFLLGFYFLIFFFFFPFFYSFLFSTPSLPPFTLYPFSFFPFIYRLLRFQRYHPLIYRIFIEFFIGLFSFFFFQSTG